MVEVSTSILSLEKENILKELYNLEVGGTDYFHIDVMDGEFVENNTVDNMKEYTQYIKQISNTPIDVHLMVKDVEKYAKEYIDLDVNKITFHVEALKNKVKILEQISYIKQNNVKVGISIKPQTKIEEIYNYLPYIHSVLIMTVEPGKGGQKFIEETVEKISQLNKFIYENNMDIDIEVDGGINDETAKRAIEAGANILVAGSYIVNSQNYKEAIMKIKK